LIPAAVRSFGNGRPKPPLNGQERRWCRPEGTKRAESVLFGPVSGVEGTKTPNLVPFRPYLGVEGTKRAESVLFGPVSGVESTKTPNLVPFRPYLGVESTRKAESVLFGPVPDTE